jgi:hypothetical protein
VALTGTFACIQASPPDMIAAGWDVASEGLLDLGFGKC